MPEKKIFIRQCAVLGAGVMGAQIAGHFANAGVEVILFDLPSQEKDKNHIVNSAIQNLLKLEPAPLSSKAKALKIQAANYADHLDRLKDCDLIIEAVSEKMEIKKDLYSKISPYLSPTAIVASNTSGISIEQLAGCLPANQRERFCGVHFFNPPRYLSLVELIPHSNTDQSVLFTLENFFTSYLGKDVVFAKDTPNFIANRIGVFSFLTTIHYVQKYELGFDVADALTGTLIGRAKSGTFRTLDVVGLDTLMHVINTMHRELENKDPWHSYFKAPEWMSELVKLGALGQKAGAGCYKKVGKEIQVIDLQTKSYRPSQGKISSEVESIFKLPTMAEKIKALISSQDKQAMFLWDIFRELFVYTANQLGNIAHSARDIDLAMRYGFGWKMGAFETWQAAGWQTVCEAIQKDIKEGKRTLTNTPLPEWACDKNFTEIHSNRGSFSAVTKEPVARPQRPLHLRQKLFDPLYGEKNSTGETVWENDGVRLWTHTNKDISILSFKSKMHAIGDEVLDGILKAITLSEENFKGMIIWQNEPPFSVGANLAQVVKGAAAQEFDKLSLMVKKFQEVSTNLKYAKIPTVAAAQGFVLGGGCEVAIHCSRIVCSLETYMGLPEVGVGLLPAGGGTKEFALRAAKDTKGNTTLLFPFIAKGFEQLAMGKVSRSAEEAREMGFLRDTDKIVFHPRELLYVAEQEILCLDAQGYRPPPKATHIPVCGKGGIATLKTQLLNMLEGKMISDHDFAIGSRIAEIICGGNVEQTVTVSEDWLLHLEFTLFMELLKTEKSQARIKYMLENGKPLRN